MQIEATPKLDFKDVLIRPKPSTAGTRAEVNLTRTFRFPHSLFSMTCVPLMASNMDTIGTLKMDHALAKHGCVTCLHKYYHVEDIVTHLRGIEEPVPFITFGLKGDDLFRAEKIHAIEPLRFICIDAANGYTQFFKEQVTKYRQCFPDAVIMAGNVATPEMVQHLVWAGADIVKIGIGPGSVCLTRNKTGVGYPQLSAIIECAEAAHGVKAHICADGGCREAGDVAKAFGAGADFVMLGGMLAGHDEGAQFLRAYGNGREKVRFWGMASEEALDRYHGGADSYRAIEGKCIEVEKRGPVGPTIRDILGGLRSACTYVGAMRLKDLSKCTTFVVKR